MKLDTDLGSGVKRKNNVPVHRFKQLMVGGVATPPDSFVFLDFRDTCEDQITTTEADADWTS